MHEPATGMTPLPKITTRHLANIEDDFNEWREAEAHGTYEEESKAGLLQTYSETIAVVRSLASGEAVIVERCVMETVVEVLRASKDPHVLIEADVIASWLDEEPR